MTNVELARRCACSFMQAESAEGRRVADASISTARSLVQGL